MTTTPHSGTDGLTEDQNLSFRTQNRWDLWATNFRCLRLAGLCCKFCTDRDQRRMSPTLQQFTEELAVVEVARECSVIGTDMREPKFGQITWQN